MRVEPRAGAHAYKTYSVKMPLATHFRPATCAEVNCPAHLYGWRVHVEALTPDLVHAARTAGRRYREEQLAEGQTYLVFEAGQPCFKATEHRTRVERPELYVVRGGDWRGNPRGEDPVVHSGPDSWLDDFASHQDKLADAANHG